MKNKTRIGVITLAAGHSLILGSITQDNKLGINNDLNSFGLLHLAPDETIAEYASLEATSAEDNEEFIRPIYRGLSETIVRRSFDPIDFSEPGVLKESMHLMKGQTIYTNHFAYIGNEIGAVEDVLWENAYTVNGMKIPAGFNLQMKIDAKSNPKLARGIMMDPPSIHSNSVTVNFAWEQSHPKMEYHEFRGKVGTMGSDGKLIRRVVTGINNYFETSLVSHGADPYAKKVGKDGKIVNPVMAHQRDSFSEELGRSSNYFAFSFKENQSFSATDALDGTEETIPNNDNNKNDNTNKLTMDKKLALALALIAGFQMTPENLSLSDENFSEGFDPKDLLAALSTKADDLQNLSAEAAKVPDLTKQVEDLTAEKATLEEDKAGLETKVISLTADAASITPYKASLLQETLNHHTVLNGGTPDESIKATLEAAGLETLQAFHTTFKGQLEKSYPNLCQDCGSDNVARNSAKAEDGEDGDDKGKGKSKAAKFDMGQARDKFRNA